MKHRLYIDEVGNHDLKSSSNPNERFLSLTGVSIKLDFVKSTLHPEMEKLKTDFFGSHPDEPVVLHRKELLKGKPPFQALRDDSIRSEFNRQLLSLLRSWEYTVITVCLDKKKHMETYSTWHYHAYHYC
ncbi:MAG: DUF3800 domain-containing protein, partial [candidate division Zixibacteria bacterium]|nr:DUF3800 domain-containing protein [candidate division Zixibacteria bacterium]